MRMKLTIPCLFVLCSSLAGWSDAGDVKNIKATIRWAAKSPNEGLKKLAPKSGYLTNQKALEELWAAWKVKGDAPKIDFTKGLVLVHLAGGPNIPSASYTLDAEGNLRAKVVQTLIGGPGFGYSIEILPREGIKTYQGKPID